ncbi:MAG TPA: hypothetical protein VM537_25465 [Anaerolineae bacterium]|nr:hypothetical protein [Anaerolineae bacterium]
MPRIFDNIDQHLLGALQETLQVSDRADFCVGYFNLRGWKQLDHYVERWGGGEGRCCRLLVGMQRLPEEELRAGLGLAKGDAGIDNKTAAELKAKLAQAFRDQLAVGAPSNEDERGLRRLAAQIKARKVVVKLFLRHPLHAKLYLLFRPDPINPTVGYLGSSNLTLAGLSQQGVRVKWRWDTSDSPAGLPVSPEHSTIWDHSAAPSGAVAFSGVSAWRSSEPPLL